MGQDSMPAENSVFKAIANFAPVLIFQSDSIGHCTWFNDTWLSFRGTQMEGEIGEGWLNGVHPEDGQRFLYIFRNAYAARTPFETVFRLKRRDTIYRWMKIRGVPFTTGSEFSGFVATCFDITDSKIAHDKLQQSEVRHRKLLEEALVGFIEVDTKGYIRYANPAFCRMLGYTQIEVLNKSNKDLIYAEDYDYLVREKKKIIENKQKFVELELRYSSKNKTPVYVLVKISGIRNESGVISAFNSQIIDVTKRFELERSIQSANSRFNLALKAGKLGVWEWDLQNNVMIWDNTQYELYGLSRENDKVNWPYWEKYIHPKDRDTFEEELCRSLDGAETNVFQYRIITSDGSVRVIRSNAILERDEAKNPLRIIGLTWDITDSIHREQELEKQRAINSFSNRLVALSDMAKIIAREVNEPLNDITNAAQQVLISGSENLNLHKNLAEKVQIINESAQKIAEIISTLQQSSNSSVCNEFVKAHLVELISESITFHRVQLRDLGIEVRADIQSFADLEILCIPRQMVHAFMTLVSNSIESIKNLDEKWIEISISLKENKVEVTFMDSGTVLPQTDNGLGLKVLKSIVDNNGGQIYFDPLSLQTTFVVELPIALENQLIKSDQAAA